MYPFAIINSFGSKIERVYRDFARRVNKEIFPMLSTSPQFQDVVGQILVSPSPLREQHSQWRGATSKKQTINKNIGVRLDAANVLELLEEIRLTYGDYVDQEKLEKIIAENIELLDGWSTSQLNKMINEQNAVIGSGVGVIGQDAMNRVSTANKIPLIPRKSVVAMANIPLANNTQRLLQNDAYSKYFFDVEEIINKGILKGTSADEITKQILDKVDMNAKRARFWAEDQASIFQAEQTRVKAQREGYTHYRWKCQGNARPSHAVHRDQIYSWNVGVNNLSRPGARHPGEDYRCHCSPALVTPEEIAKAGVGSPPPREPQSTAGLVENYNGSEKVKADKGKAFIESMNSTVANVAQNIVQSQVAKVIQPAKTAKAKSKGFNQAEFDLDLETVSKEYGVEWTQQDMTFMDNGKPYTMRYKGNFQGQEITLNRTFKEKPDGFTVFHDYFKLPEELQGGGFSKDVFQTLYKQYQNVGVKKISVYANIDVGGYTWANYGFVATDKNDVFQIFIKANNRLKNEGIINQFDPVKKKWMTMNQADMDDMKKVIQDFYANNPDSKEFPMNKISEKPYGKIVLLGSNWDGKLSLTNKARRTMFEQYMRKKK